MSNMNNSVHKTPDKINTSLSLERSTPNKDLTGVAKTAFTHASNVNSYIEQWRVLQKKGLIICRTVQAMKLHEIIGGIYPPQLITLSDSLLEVINGMKYILEGMQTISKQLNALAKLCPESTGIVNTWSASKLATQVDSFIQIYTKEFQLNKTVVENICHSRDEYLTETYVCSWEYDIFMDNLAVALFKAEMGFSKTPYEDT